MSLIKNSFIALGLLLSSSALTAAELTVSAAQSLSHAFTSIGQQFEKETGHKVSFNFAASGNLLQQIEKGAPVDIFASADQATMQQALTKKLMHADSVKDFVANQLVLIVPSTSALKINEVKDLTQDGVKRITIGNPASVPVGRYAKEVMEAEKVYTTLEPKFVFGENVRQVLTYVSQAEVEAGFVFSTEVPIAKDKVKVVKTLSTKTPITYPIGIVAASQQSKIAQEFIDYVLSDAGYKVLAEYGFSKP